EAVLRFAPEAAEQAAALGAHRESAAQYARALRFADRLGPAERAALLERRSYECLLTDQIDEAIGTLEVAIGLRRELSDVRGEGQALEQLANVLWCPGRVAEAREATLQAVTLLESIPPGRELAAAYCRMAQLCMDSEDAEEPVEWGSRSLELARELGERQIAVHTLNSMGTARLLRNDSGGQEQLEQSLRAAVDAGLDDDIGRAIAHLGWTAQRRRAY